jgi:hypothetical protein
MRPRVGPLRQPLARVLAVVLLAALSAAVAGSVPDEPRQRTVVTPEFRFARLAYQDSPDFGMGRFGRFGGRGSWLTDAPEAEMHFLQGMKRLTRINAGDDSIGVGLGNETLFDFPFLYAVEVGRWYLSEAEAARLRDYLLRGGFLMVDDFHGSLQWESFMESMRRVFPDREVTDIPDGHEVFNVLYDLDSSSEVAVRGAPERDSARGAVQRPVRRGSIRNTQIPGIFALMNGQTYEQDGVDPHWRGIFDDDGRLMVAINHNMDLGDAWEHANTPEYPQPLTALAYRVGINYVLYTMTH